MNNKSNHIILFFIILYLSQNLFSQSIYNFEKAELKEVKLSRNFAELFHEVELNIKKGTHEYYINNIAKTIDIQTLKINYLDNIKIENSVYFIDDLDSVNYKLINDSINNLDIEINEIKDFFEESKLKDFLAQNKNQTKTNKTIDSLISKLNSLIKAKIELEDKLSKTEINENFIKIIISSNDDTKTKLNLSYIASNAGWELSYDLYVNDNSDKAKLARRASINQFTGIYWGNTLTQLINSKSDKYHISKDKSDLYNELSKHERKPKIKSSFASIKGTVYTDDSLPAIGAYVQIIGHKNGAMVNREGTFETPSIEYGTHQLKVVYVSMEDKLVNVNHYPNQSKPIEIKLIKSDLNESEINTNNIISKLALSPGERSNNNSEYVVRDCYSLNTRILVDGVEIDTRLGQIRSNSSNSLFTSSSPKSYDFYDNYNLKEKFTDEVFDISRNISVKNQTFEKIILLDHIELESKLIYKFEPSLSHRVSRIIEIPNFNDYNLEGVKISKFYNAKSFNDGYVYSTRNQKGQINFGYEDSIKANSSMILKNTKTKLFSTDVIDKFVYEYEILNHVDRNVEIIIEDKVPTLIDENNELEITDKSNGTIDQFGIITWKVNLEPNEQITKKLKFNVTHPGSAVIRK